MKSQLFLKFLALASVVFVGVAATQDPPPPTRVPTPQLTCRGCVASVVFSVPSCAQNPWVITREIEISGSCFDFEQNCWVGNPCVALGIIQSGNERVEVGVNECGGTDHDRVQVCGFWEGVPLDPRLDFVNAWASCSTCAYR